MEIDHTPVMPAEVLENLLIPPGHSVMIDCTTGEGGHSSLFLSHYPELSVIGIDRDAEIQKKAIERLSAYGDRFTPVLSWFNDYLASAESGSADAILFDLGISMFHYAESGRGFSFRGEEELDMRLDKDGDISARDIVNGYSEESLADVIYRYGEERYSRRIARAIACVDSGAGIMPSQREKSSPALSASFCSMAYDSISPSCLSWLTICPPPW